MTALNDLRAVLLITKHLVVLLSFLLAIRNVPDKLPRRIGLLERVARGIAEDPELAQDWYSALELLSGEDLSARSVAELMELSVELLSVENLGDVWRIAYQIGLIDEDMLKQWVMLEELRNAS